MRYLFISLSMLWLSLSSPHAEIPFSEGAGVYEATHDDQKDNSPLWAMVGIHSGILENIRFFGHYGSLNESTIFPAAWMEAHLKALVLNDAVEKNNVPRDGISALLQHLFRSPDGEIFAQNDNNNEAVVDLVKDDKGNINLTKMNTLLTLLLNVKKQAPAAIQWDDVKKGILSIFGYDKPKDQIPSLNNNKQRKHFLATNFADILTSALKQEMTPTAQPLYPENICVISLLTYAWKMTNTRQDLEKLTILLDPAKLNAVPFFDATQYDMGKAAFIAEMDGAQPVSPGHIALFKIGHNAYGDGADNPVPTPITMKFHVKYSGFPQGTYPDCGETSLRNFFYIVFNKKGVFHAPYFDEFVQKLPPQRQNDPILQKIKTYFMAYPNPSTATTDKAHNEWSEVVSGLRGPIPIHYYRGGGVCDIHPGLMNMLNVFAALIPDDTLGSPWDMHPTLKFKQVEKKLDQLCTLFTRHGYRLDWKNGNTKKITQNTGIKLTFNINRSDSFAWSFTDMHFQISKIPQISYAPGVNTISFENPHLVHPFLKGFFMTQRELFAIGKSAQDMPITPTIIYSHKLSDPDLVMDRSERILAQGYVPFYPLLPKWLKNLMADPNYASKLQALAYTYPGFINLFPATDQVILKTFNGKLFEKISKIRKELPDISTALHYLNFISHVDNNEKNHKVFFKIIKLAIENNEWLPVVALFLDKGMDPNCEITQLKGLNGENSETPLSTALEWFDNPNLIQLLLDKGADPNKPYKDTKADYGDKRRSPLFRAIKEKHINSALLLMNRGAIPAEDDLVKGLKLSLTKNNAHALDIFLKQGASISNQDINEAIKTAPLDVVQLLLKKARKNYSEEIDQLSNFDRLYEQFERSMTPQLMTVYVQVLGEFLATGQIKDENGRNILTKFNGVRENPKDTTVDERFDIVNFFGKSLAYTGDVITQTLLDQRNKAPSDHIKKHINGALIYVYALKIFYDDPNLFHENFHQFCDRIRRHMNMAHLTDNALKKHFIGEPKEIDGYTEQFDLSRLFSVRLYYLRNRGQ